MDKICISEKNSKLGKIPNISLPPIVTCRANAPCVKDCYANRFYRMYPNVKAAWDRNLACYKENPYTYFEEIKTYLEKKQPRLFRWHVGGDIPDNEYLVFMCIIARMFPKTKFLAYTKQFEILERTTPMYHNLSIVLSAWPGLEIDNPYGLPVAWFQDGTETRIPDDAITCSCDQQCDKCKICWNLAELGKDIVFNKH